MTKTKLILSIVSCLLLSMRAYAQQPDGHSEDRKPESALAAIEAEIQVRLQQLEFKITELAVDEAQVEYEKIKLQLEAAEEQADVREVGYAKLELKQAALRIETRKIQSQMARLQIERAKAGLEHLRTARKEKPAKPSQVRVEFMDDSDVVVIRGAEANVKKLVGLLEGLEKEQEKP